MGKTGTGTTRREFLIGGTALAAGALAGCRARPRAPAGKILLGFVAKSRANPVFRAAESAARAAAADKSGKYGIPIELSWLAPEAEDAEEQARMVDGLVREGAAGLAVSCSDGNVLAPSIDRAVDAGIPAICFDSDSPRSRRLCSIGIDDHAAGSALVAALAAEMGEKGSLAILAGREGAPNLTRRLEGARDELGRHPGLSLVEGGVVQHEESPAQASAAIARMQKEHPAIEGWCFLGGWPLFERNALPWGPGEVKVVSMDALPSMLPYLESGHAAALFLQRPWNWGTRSVEVLLAKILLDEGPPGPLLFDPVEKLGREGIAECRKSWGKWLGGGG